MSEINSSSFNEDDQGNGNELYSKYEKISSFVDREFDDTVNEDEISKDINNDIDLYNRYQVELAIKNELHRRIISVTVPPELAAKINEGIRVYSKQLSGNFKLTQSQKVFERTNNLINEIKPEIYRTSLQQKKYFYAFAGTFAFLLFIFLLINFYNQSGNSHDEDLVSISHEIFDKIEKGEMKLQIETHDPQILENQLEKKCNFNVYVPDVKDATLLGGVFNEINGVPVAHFIHRKGNSIIYTFQTKRNEITDKPNEKDKLYLISEVRERLNKGENWFPCQQKHSKGNAAIWFKDDVLCSSISKMNFEQIHATLTDFR